MKFSEMATTRKGSIGEKYVRNLFEKMGYVVYGALTEDKAHLFDFMAANKAEKKMFIAEVKSKSKRKVYDDTGIDHRHFLEYQEISKKYNMDVFLMFVDEENALVYGNFLSVLEQDIVCNTTGSKSHNVLYPLTYSFNSGSTLHFWPISRMGFIARIDGETVKVLQQFTTKQEMYKQSGDNGHNRTMAILGTQLKK